jgi:hypothetical protein
MLRGPQTTIASAAATVRMVNVFATALGGATIRQREAGGFFTEKSSNVNGLYRGTAAFRRLYGYRVKRPHLAEAGASFSSRIITGSGVNGE